MRGQPYKLEGRPYAKNDPGSGTTFVPCGEEEATHLRIKIPDRKGFFGENMIPDQIKGTRAGTGNWTWNGDTERPTLKPSLLSTCGGDTRCHTWITEGKAVFLGDCTHEYAGQTLNLLDLD